MSIQHRKTNKIVLVIGQRRSGTSMLAGVLDHLGVPMGVKGGGQVSEKNPKGFYEDREFDAIFRQVLDEYNATGNLRWNKWRLKYEHKLKELVQKRNEKGVWGLKNPNLPLFHKIVTPYLDNLRVLVIFRNPLSVVMSVKDWHNNHPIFKIMDSVNWQNGLCADCLKEYISMPIPYEDMLLKPDEYIKQIIKFLDIKPTKEQIKSAKEFIDIKLKHF